MSRFLPPPRFHLAPPIDDVVWIEIDEPRVDTTRTEQGLGRERVFVSEAREPWRHSDQGQKLGEVSADMFSSDKLWDLLLQLRLIGTALIVVNAWRVVVDQSERARHGISQIRPKPTVRVSGHRHEEWMAYMATQSANIGGAAEAIEHPPRVAPGDTNLARNAEAKRLIGEDIDDPSKLRNLIGVELAVAIGAGDTVDTGRIQASNILTEDSFVKPVVLIKRGRDRRPNAVQIVMGQPLRHRDRCFSRHPLSAGSLSARSPARLI